MNLIRVILYAPYYLACIAFAGAVLALRRLWPAFAAQMDADDTLRGATR